MNKAVICIHGNSSSAKLFNNLKLGSDHKIVLIDLPGHGGYNSNTNKETYSVSNYKKYLLNITNKYNEVILIGHSFGGHLAIEIAPLINNLKGIVLFGTPPLKKPTNIEEAFLPYKYLNTFFTPNVDPKTLDSTVNSLASSKNVTTLIKNDFINTNPNVRLQIGLELVSGENVSNEFQLLKELTCKKLILHGELDPIVNLDYLHNIKNECNFDLEIFENTGHYIPLDSPNKFNTAIIKFID